MPFESTSHGCDAPDDRVLVPALALAVGASDWEAEGLVAARTLHVSAFRIDAFEVTRGRYERAADGDALRAESGMTRDEASSFCAAAGGRLPSETEWMAAASWSGADADAHSTTSSTLRRYPWGDTGAVCRRGAWGLRSGPCGVGADGPDSVGAHRDGDSPLGLHDLAGNVAEWVTGGGGTRGGGSEGGEGGEARQGAAFAKGGSWQSSLASDLRLWARIEVSAGGRDPRVGFRCVYPP